MHRFYRIILAMVLAGGPVRAVEDPLEPLRDELASLRIQMARTKMELGRTLDRLGELREFLLAHQVDQTLEQWRAQRQAMIQQRQQVAEQRKQLEQQLAEKNGKLAEVPPAKAPAKPDVAAGVEPKWIIHYQIAIVPTDRSANYIYVEPTRGDWLLELFPQMDRKSIMVRGTIQNASAEVYRATFEVRLADKFATLVGSWRYQTPLLAAGDQHTFEIRVPATDVSVVDRYQITNIESDRPPAQP